MLLAITLAALAGLAALVLIPMGFQLLRLLHDLIRYPLKVQQLSRVTVAIEEMCRRKPDITQSPEFSQAIGQLVQQIRSEAREARYPLLNAEVIDAVIVGIQDSGTIAHTRLLEIERRILRALA